MLHSVFRGNVPIRPRLPTALTRFATRAIHLAARLTRPMTLGARVAIFDAENRVVLVQHSYLRGWHLPGGGVEPGETLAEAARREVGEETGLMLDGPLTLHGMFFNRQASRRDHVAVFVATVVAAPSVPVPTGLEITDRGFFPVAALPADTARATRTRIEEIIRGTVPAGDW